VTYDYAGEVPMDEKIPYITRCTSYPAQQDLDSCREGQFVWFQKKTLQQLANGPMLVRDEV